MEIAVPQNILSLLGALEQQGHRAYVVGGCVRDSLMGKTPADWDVATSALPDEVTACFGRHRVLDTGRRHGTVTVLLEHIPVEVTTFRVDGLYFDSRHPDSVSFTQELHEDLCRRDFTINAMAWNPREGLTDLFGGQEDLRRGRIVCVGDPTDRFREDALRILRAVRFACVLDFTVEDSTARAMSNARAGLGGIAVERIHVELDKALLGPGLERVFTKHLDVVLEILPELAPCVGLDQKSPYHDLDVWAHSLRATSLAPPELQVRLALLLHDCGKPSSTASDSTRNFCFHEHTALNSAAIVRTLLARMHYSNSTRIAVEQLVADHAAPIRASTKSIKRWLNRMGEERFLQLLAMKNAHALAHAAWYVPDWLNTLERIQVVLDQVLCERQCYCMKDLLVNGDDLMAQGMPRGREVGMILNLLLDAVIEERLPNQREALLEFAREYIR